MTKAPFIVAGNWSNRVTTSTGRSVASEPTIITPLRHGPFQRCTIGTMDHPPIRHDRGDEPGWGHVERRIERPRPLGSDHGAEGLRDLPRVSLLQHDVVSG